MAGPGFVAGAVHTARIRLALVALDTLIPGATNALSRGLHRKCGFQQGNKVQSTYVGEKRPLRDKTRKWDDILRGIWVCCRTLPPTRRRRCILEASRSGRARNREEGCTQCSRGPGSPCDICQSEKYLFMAFKAPNASNIISSHMQSPGLSQNPYSV